MRTLDNNVRIRDVGGQLAGATDVADANVVIHHALQVGLKVALEQAHEEADLGARSAQIVFQRKGVEREPRQADARGGLSNQLHALGALLVAEEALERALASPASIAVHDDGHVLGQALGLQRRIDSAFFISQFMDAQRACRIQKSRLYITFAASKAGAQGASKIDAGRARACSESRVVSRSEEHTSELQSLR